MPAQHIGQGAVDRLVQRVDRAVALGRRLPVVAAGVDHDGGPAADAAARGHGPAGQVGRASGRVASASLMRSLPVRPGSWPEPLGRRELAFVAATELGARLPDRVLERVDERLRRGRDDVGVAAHGGPGPRSVLRIDDDAGARRRRAGPVEDAHLVVHEVDGIEDRVERPQRLAQRAVERVHGTVAVGGGVEHLAGDLDLDGGLGQQLPARPLLDQRRVVDDPERRLRSRACCGGSAARTTPRRPRTRGPRSRAA